MSDPIVEPGANLYAGFPISEFDWILDKHLLRDEGIYFGLSDMAQTPTEKVEAIRHFFQERIEALGVEYLNKSNLIQQLAQMMEDQLLHIRQKQSEILSLKSQLVLKPHDFWRSLVGFLVYGIILIFNYWLIYTWLSDAQVKSPLWTTLGVYLFGSLSLFGRFSLMYNTDEKVLNAVGEERESWKVYLEEFFIPLIASIYVCYRGAGDHAFPEIAIFFLLIYAQFLFTGKGILNQLVKLKSEVSVLWANLELQRRTKRQVNQLDAEIGVLNSARNAHEAKLQILKDNALDIEKAIAMIKEQKETNVLLFLSEYELAKASRQNLNNKQIGRILSSRR